MNAESVGMETKVTLLVIEFRDGMFYLRQWTFGFHNHIIGHLFKTNLNLLVI
jgi:hypothetical protein